MRGSAAAAKAEKIRSWKLCVEEDKIRLEFKYLKQHIEEYGFKTPFQWYAFTALDQRFEDALKFQNHYQWHAFRVLGMPFDKAVQITTPHMISRIKEGDPFEKVVQPEEIVIVSLRPMTRISDQEFHTENSAGETQSARDLVDAEDSKNEEVDVSGDVVLSPVSG